MADINNFPDVPGYVSIKQAAEMLGITDKRVYRYIEEGRLQAYKSGGVFMLSVEAVKQFKLNPPGRVRTQPPPWRVYNKRSKLVCSEIVVKVRKGQQTRLLDKLRAIQDENHHTFAGTMQRYIKWDAPLASIRISLYWKDTEMPDEATRQQNLADFQAELADVLDWDTAQYYTGEVLIHT
jgi:excisionase family DNA binding protein